MNLSVWMEGEFKIISYGNGTAYEVATVDGTSFFVQGEDAESWRADYDKACELGRVDAFMRTSMEEYGYQSDGS